MSIKKTPYCRRYTELEKKGLGYFEIRKIMKRDIDKNEVSGKVLYIYSETEYLGEAHFCSECGEKLTKEDFFFEVTARCCDLWYKCNNCNTFNHFKEFSEYPLNIGDFVKISNSMNTHYGEVVSLNPLKTKISKRVTQTLKGDHITIITKESIPEQSLNFIYA